MQSSLAFQPLSIGQTLRRTAELCRDNLGLLMTLAAITLLPAQVLAMLGGPRWMQNIVNLVGILAFQCVVTSVVARSYLGRPADVETSLAAFGSVAGKLVTTSLLVGVLVLLGLVCLVVPGILVAIWSMFVCEVVLLEGLTGMDAFKRSKQLSQSPGTLLRQIGLSLILGYASLALSVPLGVGFKFLLALAPSGALLWALLISASLVLIAGPFGAVLCAVTYFDVLVRHEAFDAGALAARLDAVATS